MTPKPQINYARAAYQSLPNLCFIGVMIFLSLAISPGFLFLLAAGEFSILLLMQSAPIRRIIRARLERQWRRGQEEIENQILDGLPESYKKDFHDIKQLCLEIERRAGEVEKGKTLSPLVEEIVEKLIAFRFEHVRMLRAHFLLAHRDYQDLQRRLDAESKRLQEAADNEQSEQVRATIDQNLKILRQRVVKLRQLAELVRLIEMRLQVVRNSLQLIQDEVYSMTDVRGISSIVDELLVNMELNEEVRSYYNDMLSGRDSTLATLDAIDPSNPRAELSAKLPPRSDQARGR